MSEPIQPGRTALKKFAGGMLTMMKVLEDYPDDLRKRVDWEEFVAALADICDGVSD